MLQIRKAVYFLTALIGIITASAQSRQQADYQGTEYIQLKSALCTGWNTWNTSSVLSHVLLPEAIAVDCMLKDKAGAVLKEALIGKKGTATETILPIAHTNDGAYTELIITWHGMQLRVQSAAKGRDISLLISPVDSVNTGEVIIHPRKIWWDRQGSIAMEQDHITYAMPSGNLVLYAKGRQLPSDNTRKELVFSAATPIVLSTKPGFTESSIRKELEQAKQNYLAEAMRYKNSSEVYQVMQNVLAWDMIFDPEGQRELTTVSRLWNGFRGGFVIFCWDNYFVSLMHAIDNKALAYANAIEITNSITGDGFVPNLSASMGIKSFDRSQPPVGSFVVKEIYKRYREEWFLQEVFPKLLTWNRWWEKNRDRDGYLCWGSSPFAPYLRNLDKNAHSRFGAALESGLDNSPMYDDIPFDSVSNTMLLGDVGLMSLYILDCESLAEIAGVLHKDHIRKELKERAVRYRKKLSTMWSEEKGIYLNRRLDTNSFSDKISPTNFYPLLANAPDQQQAERMIKEHFYNPAEFYGKYMMASIAKNDPGYNNDYWRGRVWAPMNFLVYLGMRNYALPMARKEMVEKSKSLFLEQWKKNGYACENYNALTGECDDMRNSDLFYHWSGLLGFMDLIENGYMAPTKQAVSKK
jgi:putative isomerase